MNSTYYKDMLNMDRLVPLDIEGRVKGIVTYVLCNSPEEVNIKNPFEPRFTSEGSHCYIEQFISQMKLSIRESLSSFKCLLDILQKKHPDVRVIFWKRYNKNTKKLGYHFYNLKQVYQYN